MAAPCVERVEDLGQEVIDLGGRIVSEKIVQLADPPVVRISRKRHRNRGEGSGICRLIRPKQLRIVGIPGKGFLFSPEKWE